MSRLKTLMIISSTNNSRSIYFPMDSPQEMINELEEVANRMKTVLYKGIIETQQNKFTYQHYIPKNDIKESDENETQDRPIIIISSDKSCKDNKIEKVFEEIFESLNELNQKNSKMSDEAKTKIGNIFLKYQNINEIKESNLKEIEFGTIEELTGFDTKSVSNSTFFDTSESIADPKRRSRLRNMEKKKREEIENIKRWRKIKIVYLFISIILLILTIFSIIYSFIH